MTTDSILFGFMCIPFFKVLIKIEWAVVMNRHLKKLEHI